MPAGDASFLLRTARTRSGLSQRALAKRAGTSQSVVARIESGHTDPSYETLRRLLRAAGFELQAEVQPTLVGRSHMLDDIRRILRLTPEQRLLELRNAARLLAHARRSGA